MDTELPLSKLRFDHAGSLLRPSGLKEAFARYEQHEIDGAALARAQDEAIAKAVAHEEAIGLPLVTDGEFRRLNFQDSFGAAVSGYDSSEVGITFHQDRVAGGGGGTRWDPGYVGAGPAVAHRLGVTKPLQLERDLVTTEYSKVAALTSKPASVAIIGPDRISQRFDAAASRSVYDSIEAFLIDVVAIEQTMIANLVNAGCQYVHIDEPGYTAYVDGPSLEQMRARGDDPAAALTRSIAADNELVRAFADTVFGVHLCRGNQASMWHREGTYDAIAEELFSTLAHHRLLLEYDTERAGGFEPLRFVPRDKVVVLGLVSSKVPALESRDELLRRIDEAGEYLPVEQLALSTQCGFASDVSGNRLTEADQWKKFELILDVIDEVWSPAK